MNSMTGLMRSRRFLPLFLTQALGALNDNVFKNALMIWLAFTLATSSAQSNLLINAAAGLFILPFFLFSAVAGQVADRYEKSALIRRIKLAEIGIMSVGAVAVLMQSVAGLLAVLFLMGAQSALFGPVKYGILPQHLKDNELTAGNGWIEMGTFLAILIGTLLGGSLAGLGSGSTTAVAVAILVLAGAGYLCARHIPLAPATAPDLRLNFNPFSATWQVLDRLRQNRTILLACLGISWFWFFGATYLTQLPSYTRDVLGGDAGVVTLLLALFSVGVGVGSLACERLSGHKVEIGLVPLGSIGLSVFAVDLYFAFAPSPIETLRDVGAFLALPGAWRVLTDVVLIGLFGGIYIVPLYALIQQRAAPSERSRTIAGNNILNAAFMVVAAIFAAVALSQGLSIPQLFLACAVMNALVAIFIYSLVPEFLIRFVVWILINTLYRLLVRGLEQVPDDGPALLVCNHVSFVDALILGGTIRRPVRFVMYWKIFQIPVLSWLFRTIKAIPVAPAKENPELLALAMDTVDAELAAGHVVCIFPEGGLTPNGDIQTFRSGATRIVERRPVPVIPLALSGVWGSVFSRSRKGPTKHLPRRFWSRLELDVGPAIAPDAATPEHLQAAVSALRQRP